VSILDEIVATKAPEVAARKRERSVADLEANLPKHTVCDFAAALAREPGQSMRVIAEYKRASPSAGEIRGDLEVEEVARQYRDAGAAAMSILTDERFFSGSLDYLRRARAEVSIPLLRKDFIVDPYQVLEAAQVGADAVLLIVAALDSSQLDELFAATGERGLAALVEVHSEAEAAVAVECGARVIGVNHRDLNTFEVDLGLTSRLRHAVPKGTVLVAESGVRGPADVARLGADGADAVLVGEHLMRAPRPGRALEELLQGDSP